VDNAEEKPSVLVPMRDGFGLPTNIYSPEKGKGSFRLSSGKRPIASMTLKAERCAAAIQAVKRGFVFVVQNERGRYFSEGDYEILGGTLTTKERNSQLSI